MGIEISYKMRNYIGMQKNNIKKLRKNKKLTQQQLGRMLGVEKGYVSRMENYEADDAIGLTHDRILDICKALECTPNDLLIMESTQVGNERMEIIKSSLEEYLQKRDIQLSAENKSKVVDIIYGQQDEVSKMLEYIMPILEHDISLVISSIKE